MAAQRSLEAILKNELGRRFVGAYVDVYTLHARRAGEIAPCESTIWSVESCVDQWRCTGKAKISLQHVGKQRIDGEIAQIRSRRAVYSCRSLANRSAAWLAPNGLSARRSNVSARASGLFSQKILLL